MDGFSEIFGTFLAWMIGILIVSLLALLILSALNSFLLALIDVIPAIASILKAVLYVFSLPALVIRGLWRGVKRVFHKGNAL